MGGRWSGGGAFGCQCLAGRGRPAQAAQWHLAADGICALPEQLKLLKQLFVAPSQTEKAIRGRQGIPEDREHRIGDTDTAMATKPSPCATGNGEGHRGCRWRDLSSLQ
eukprot:GGOE01004575.1.p2 GENE.GGOE01004575.1~~GGOE01004575.1.p2  ORF type:complete len:116 (-),score=8.11 GGOE01004575.1:419-742(-)